MAIGTTTYSIINLLGREGNYPGKLGWRNNPKIDFKQAKLGLIGGVQSKLNPFESIKEEIELEVGLSEEEISFFEIIGVTERENNLERKNFEISFLVKTYLDSLTIFERHKRAKEQG